MQMCHAEIQNAVALPRKKKNPMKMCHLKCRNWLTPINKLVVYFESINAMYHMHLFLAQNSDMSLEKIYRYSTRVRIVTELNEIRKKASKPQTFSWIT